MLARHVHLDRSLPVPIVLGVRTEKATCLGKSTEVFRLQLGKDVKEQLCWQGKDWRACGRPGHESGRKRALPLMIPERNIIHIGIYDDA